jgi:hypothetical protein
VGKVRMTDKVGDLCEKIVVEAGKLQEGDKDGDLYLIY